MATDNAMYNDPRFKAQYSTAGNLTDRGYPSSYDGATGAKVIETHASLPTKTNNNSGGKASTGSSSSSSSSNSGYDMAAYLAELNAQRQAAAEDAYNRSMGYLNDAYNEAAGNYWDIYKNGEGTLQKAYDASRTKINNQASDSMKEAYINKMLSMKNLSQKLAAMGISGGASESTMAGLINNYGNARNNIQRTWNDNLSDLDVGYNSNLANLYNSYLERISELNNNRASQAAQLLSNLNNQIASVQNNFYSSLMSNPQLLQQAIGNAVQGVNDVEIRPTEATNTYNPVNTQQNNDMGGTMTNWSREQLENLANGDESLYNRILKMSAQKLTPNQIATAITGFTA